SVETEVLTAAFVLVELAAPGLSVAARMEPCHARRQPAMAAPQPKPERLGVIPLALINGQVSIVQRHREQRGRRGKSLSKLTFPTSLRILTGSEALDVFPVPCLPALR